MTQKCLDFASNSEAYCTIRVKGLQYGFYNGANDVRGVQIGFINVTRKMKGVQIGVVNVIKEGVVPAMIAINASF